jgi:hypothetical protein
MSDSAFYRIAPGFVHFAPQTQAHMVVHHTEQDSTCMAIAVHSFGMALASSYGQVRVVAGEEGMQCSSCEAGRVLACSCAGIDQRQSRGHIQVELEGSLRLEYGLVSFVGVGTQAPMSTRLRLDEQAVAARRLNGRSQGGRRP